MPQILVCGTYQSSGITAMTREGQGQLRCRGIAAFCLRRHVLFRRSKSDSPANCSRFGMPSCVDADYPARGRAWHVCNHLSNKVSQFWRRGSDIQHTISLFANMMLKYFIVYFKSCLLLMPVTLVSLTHRCLGKHQVSLVCGV